MNDRAALLALALLAVSCAQAGPRSDEPEDWSRTPPAIESERVVLISVGGMRPGDYGVVPGEEGGRIQAKGVVMPNLAAMATAGAYAEEMVPVLPSSVYPVHATLVTGLQPVHHGVLGDELLGPEGLHLRGLARENRIRGTTLWRAARASGLSVAALAWPSTGGADVELLLPDLGAPALDDNAPWIDQIAREATPWVVDRLNRLDESLPDLAWPTAEAQDSLIARLACEIAYQEATPSLWLLAFDQSGIALARGGPGDDQARASLREVDAAIGRIVGCFREAGLLERTTFVVVGDRSYLPVHTLIYANVILERAGLITLAPVLSGSGVASWRAFVRSFGGAGLVYAESEQDALLARRALEEQVARTRGFHIVSAAKLQALGADPQAWFGLEGEPGYGIGKTAEGKLIQGTRRRGLGGHLPSRRDTSVGFVAWGAGLRRGSHVARLSQVDVAPTVARLLRLEMPAADGSPVVGILAPRRDDPGAATSTNP